MIKAIFIQALLGKAISEHTTQRNAEVKSIINNDRQVAPKRMPLGVRLAVNTHNMGGRFVESAKNAHWSMSPQEAGDGLESMVEFQVQIKGHNQTGPITFVEIQHLHQADTLLIVDYNAPEGYQLAKINCVFSFDCGNKVMDLSLARDNRFTPGHSVSLDGINWWPADCFDSIYPRTPSDAQSLPRHAAPEVHVTQVFSLLVVGGGSISLGNNFWAATLGARTQRQPSGCHSVRYQRTSRCLRSCQDVPQGEPTGRRARSRPSITDFQYFGQKRGLVPMLSLT